MMIDRRGWTQLELVIVLAMMGIMARVAAPKLTNALSRRSAVTAADEFALVHSLARATALRYAREAQLHIDAANARFWVDVDTSGTGVRDTVGSVHSLATGHLSLSSTRQLLCF